MLKHPLLRSAVAVVSLCLPLAASANFSDVPSWHANADAIAYVQAEGIVEGYPDGSFRPDATINRAEFVKILMGGLSGSGPGAAECLQDPYVMPDVPATVWYARYVCVARNLHFIEGYPDGRFHGERSINFVEAAKILSNSYSTLNTFCSGPSPLGGPDACDPEGHAWYEWYVKSLLYQKAVPMTIQTFDQPLTRGEMAEMIYRLRTANHDKPTPSYDNLAGVGQTSSLYTYNSVPYAISFTENEWNFSNDDSIDGHYGTSLRPKGGHPTGDYLFITMPETCPDIEHLRPTPTADPKETYVFNGSTFYGNPWSEGAAGSAWQGKVFIYAYPIDNGRCLEAKTSVYSSPGGYDSPEDAQRDQVRIMELERKFEDVLHTIVLHLG